MITLNVADYCQDCPYFRAKSETITRYTSFSKDTIIGETVITCEDFDKCDQIHKHFANRTGK